MPDVKVKTPGGGTVTVRAPEGASQEDILAFAEQQYNEQKEGFMQFFGRGLKKGVEATFKSGGSAEPQGPYEPTEQFEERRGLLPGVEANYPAPKTLKGRIAQGMGEGIANPQTLLGPAGPAALAGRAIAGAASGAGSEIAGYLTKDNPLARILGGVAGGAAGGAAARPAQAGLQRAGAAIRPSIPPERAPDVRALQAQGVEPSAGDALGSATVRQLERLGDYWFGGETYRNLKQETLGEFTSVAVQAMGERGNRLTPQMIQNVENRFASRAQRAANELPIMHDMTLSNELTRIEQDMFRFGHSDEVVRRISALIEHVNNGFVTRTRRGREIGEMGGETYQGITRYGESLGQAMRENNSNIAYFAGRIRTALDDALERTVDTAVRNAFTRGRQGGPARQRAITMASSLQELRDARREWYNMIVLSKSIAGPGEAAAQGLVLPERLRANLTQGQDNKLAYAAQRSDLQRLAQAGTAIIEPYHPPGDIRRVVAPLVAAAGLFTGGAGMKSAIPLAAPGLLGRVVNSPAVQAYLKNQRTTNLMNQLMTWRQAAARGGLVGAMNQQQQPGEQRTATPVSPMMLNRAKAMARGEESETVGLPALSRQNASIGMTAGAGGPGASRMLLAKLLQQGKSYGEIAKALGISRSAVAGRIRDAELKGYGQNWRPNRLSDAEARARENPQGKVNPASDEERLRRLKQTRRPLTDAEKEDRAELERRPLRVTVHPRSQYGGSDE